MLSFRPKLNKRSFKEVERVFQVTFKDVSRKSQGVKKDSRVFQGCSGNIEHKILHGTLDDIWSN